MKPTAEYIRTRLDYNQETGIFRWKFRPNFVGRGRGWWNPKFAGTIAGRTVCNGKKNTGRKITYYIKISLDGVDYYAHVLAHVYMIGKWPEHEVDHKDNNGLNNKWVNLRPATHSQNSHNRRMQSNNAIGLKGVSYHKTRTSPKKWQAQICTNGKKCHLGFFLTKEEAYERYCNAAKERHKEFHRI